MRQAAAPIMRRRRPSRPFTIAVVSVTMLAACATIDRNIRTPAQARGQGGTLQVVMIQPTYHGFDPQSAYTAEQYELLRCCLLRTLMTYRGLPNFEGTQPVPDLATARPSVSTDGTTWTFHLRRGIRYAPPLQDVEVTAGDVVRALLRAGAEDARDGPGSQYLSSIEGFSDYARGETETISGVSTPDDYTLQIRQTKSDRSIEHVFAMPFTSPIPPLPGDPGAVLGVATGHPFASDFTGGPPDAEGYGPFLVSSGPYMIEGSEELDLTAPPREQVPTSGFSPGWWFDDPGTLVLVRNPSWVSETDPNRPARPDRIEVSIAPSGNPYPGLSDGETDLVMSENPPPRVLDEYTTSPDLQDRIATTPGNRSRFVVFNVAQPPLDDVHVRRAIALAIDRPSAVSSNADSAASHLIPDPMVGGLLSSWKGFPAVADSGDVSAARAEMDRSRYGSDGSCTGSDCRVTVVPPVASGADDPAIPSLRRALGSIGIQAVVRGGALCFDPRAMVGICVSQWITDFPDAGNMFVPFLSSEDGFQPTHLGSSPGQLEAWGYETPRVPSIDRDHERCATLAGVEAAMCWARLDQLLTSEIVAYVPISFIDVVRIRSGDITDYVIDQAFGEPALDRISVAD